MLPYDPDYVSSFYVHEDTHGRKYGHAPMNGPSGASKGDSVQAWRGVSLPAGRGWYTAGKFPDHIPKPSDFDSLSVHQKLEKLDELGLVYWPKKKGGQPRFKQFLDASDGVAMTDVVIDVPPVSSQSNERLNYPTQKPIALLERIIKASTKEGDIVLDPFCGGGTTIDAAHGLNRKWIGMDATHVAIGVSERRMKDRHGIEVDVMGLPMSMEGARDLANRDKFQFEEWAITRISGMHPNEKQVGDRGVDGRGWFRTQDGFGRVIASVKGGANINPGMVRDLIGTVESQNADMGVFVTLDEPSKKVKEAAAVGKYKIGGIVERSYPKIQIWTIRDYFDGKKPDMPELVENKKTQRKKTEKSTQTTLA